MATNPDPFKHMTEAPRGDATDGKTLKIEGTGTTSMSAHDAENCKAFNEMATQYSPIMLGGSAHSITVDDTNTASL